MQGETDTCRAWGSGKCNDNSSKLVIIIITVDGGPDENPCYSKTVMCFTDYFITYNPERSAYNRVERCKALLSRDITGLELKHPFGSHLNSAGETVDEAKEIRNGLSAGEVTSEI